MDKEKIKGLVTELLTAIGEDPDRQGLKDTPKRIANMYEEILEGYNQDPKDVLSVTYDAPQDEMVIVKDIPFYSLCEHHMVPFFGKCHVAYIPDGKKVVGISTDKAVSPLNTYGATKLLMEKLFVSAINEYSSRKYRTRFLITRYGNVVASSG